ncbi:UNVERIFIED_CONTAM: hypothetical protein Sindi_2904300 [Sesamum indicum]
MLVWTHAFVCTPSISHTKTLAQSFSAGSHGDGGDEAAGDENDVEDSERHEGAISCEESSEKFEETREEEDRTKKPTISAGSLSVDGRIRPFEDADNVPVMEDGRMQSVQLATREPSDLGFLGAEKTHGEKSMETADFSISGERRANKERYNLAAFQGCWEVGFGSGALKCAVNGGGDSSSPPIYFNIEEFLLLANRILDGDDKSKAALNDLKARWEKKFRRFAANKMVTASVPSRKPMRCVWPANKNCLVGKITGERVTVHFPPESAEENAKIPAAMSSPDSSAVSGDRTATEEMGKRSKNLDDGSPTISPANGRGASGAEVAASLDDVALCVDEVEADVAYEVNADVTADVTDARAYVTDDVTARAYVTNDVTARANVTGDVTARADITDDATARADVTADVLQKNPKFQNFSTNHTGLFMGNIPLHTYPDATVDDKIAQAFNNSTRKTLTFIAPTLQNGEVIVRPTLDIIRNGSKRWRTTAVGYFLEKRPYFHHVKELAMSVWSDLVEVTATNNGFFFFQFKTITAMEDIIEGGP